METYLDVLLPVGVNFKTFRFTNTHNKHTPAQTIFFRLAKIRNLQIIIAWQKRYIYDWNIEFVYNENINLPIHVTNLCTQEDLIIYGFCLNLSQWGATSIVLSTITLQ